MKAKAKTLDDVGGSMRLARILLAVAVAVAPVSGCLEDGSSNGGVGGGAQSENVNRTSPPVPVGVSLVAHVEFGYHSGVWGIQAHPNASEPGPAPAFCVAYRDSVRHEEDECEVRPEEETIPGGPQGEDKQVPWTIGAQWGPGSREANVTVVAFDASERAVASWTGERHPFMAHVTE